MKYELLAILFVIGLLTRGSIPLLTISSQWRQLQRLFDQIQVTLFAHKQPFRTLCRKVFLRCRVVLLSLSNDYLKEDCVSVREFVKPVIGDR
jgi:hypothetical protein